MADRELCAGCNVPVEWCACPSPTDPKPKRETQPCANCGEPTTKRWCSDSCFYHEDGWDRAA